MSKELVKLSIPKEAGTSFSLLGRLRLSQGQHAQMGTCRPVEGVQCEEAEQWSS